MSEFPRTLKGSREIIQSLAPCPPGTGRLGAGRLSEPDAHDCCAPTHLERKPDGGRIRPGPQSRSLRARRMFGVLILEILHTDKSHITKAEAASGGESVIPRVNTAWAMFIRLILNCFPFPR
ncbi:hypothetical protein R6Z07F_012700 [Ovis aries]